ncbi:MAG: DUF1415 domain-containing protein [Cellvibrionaceae bacterium]
MDKGGISNSVIEDTEAWLQQVVIGLNLCPFASKPFRAEQVRFVCSEATTEQSLLEDLQRELRILGDAKAEDIETSLLVAPNVLQDFLDYNQFLDWADQLLRRERWEGIIQIASFHPDYCFAGAAPDDAENLTNRSPYPTLHLIREDSLEAVLERYPDSDRIPDSNIEKMNQLSAKDKARLFPYLFTER